MNRRNFLKGFAVASAGALLLPDRKIWALDQTMIFQSKVDFGDHGYYMVDYYIDPGPDRFGSMARELMFGDVETVDIALPPYERLYYTPYGYFDANMLPFYGDTSQHDIELVSAKEAWETFLNKIQPAWDGGRYT